MPWETAKACIDYFYEHSVDADRVDLSFYGGEPFCNFDLIEKSTKYFDHLFCGKYKTYSMTINATLLNKKNLEFLDKFEFKLMISLNGNKKTNDKNRKFNNIDKSVYDNIIKNLKIIKNEFPNLFENTTLNIVIDPTENLDEYIKLFQENEFLNEISVRSAEIEDVFMDDKLKASEDYIQKRNYYDFLILEDVLGYVDMEDELHMFELNKTDILKVMSQLCRMDPLPEIDLPSGPCLPGCNKLFVDVYGKFYACEKYSENLDDAIIGNIKDGLDLEKSSKVFNCASAMKEDCLNCLAFRECKSCFKDAIEGFDNMSSKKQRCRIIKTDWHRALITYSFINELVSGEYKRKESIRL